MSECVGCAKWVLKEVTRYGDGSEIVNREAPPGKGCCAELGIATGPHFGCAAHSAAPADFAHIVVLETKPGAPWQHHRAGPCPDCAAKGSLASEPDPGTGFVSTSKCERCQGTAMVRHYDDGYIGEEKTRLHPNEQAMKPFCDGCARPMERGWVACPHCGQRREMPAQIEVIDLEESMHTGRPRSALDASVIGA